MASGSASTAFQPYAPKPDSVPAELTPLLAQCDELYQQLYPHRGLWVLEQAQQRVRQPPNLRTYSDLPRRRGLHGEHVPGVEYIEE